MQRSLVTTGIVAVALASSSACVETYPQDDWLDAYVPHGPLEPTSAVSNLERLTSTSQDEMFPALSPDGTNLLYISGWYYPSSFIDAPQLLRVEPGRPESATILAGTVGFALSPAWLPSGTGFLFATDQNGPWQVVRANTDSADGPFDVVLSDDVGKPLHPTVAPDESRFAFSMTHEQRRFIATANLDGTDVRLLTEGDYPSWSPWGDEIVFQAPHGDGSTQLASISPSGGGWRQLTVGDGSSVHPSHDPTGEYVVFGSTRGHEGRQCKVCCGLYLMRSDGTEVTQLMGGDVDADWAAWGADGWIYFTSNEAGHYDIWRMKWVGAMAGEPSDPRQPASPSRR